MAWRAMAVMLRQRQQVKPQILRSLGDEPIIKAVDDEGKDYWPSDVNPDPQPWVAFLKTAKGKEFIAKG